MNNNSGLFPSINVSTNGVTRLVIPYKGYSTSSAPQNPVGAFDLPSSQTIFVTAIPCPAVVQQTTATAPVSFLPKAPTLTVAEITAASSRPVMTVTIPRPTSPLSSIRFPMASRYPNKTVLAVRPKPPTVQAVWKPGTATTACTATLACTSTQGIPFMRATGISTSVPAVKVIQTRPSRPGTVSQGGKGISVITAARVIPHFSQPVFQSPLPNLAMTSNPSFRTILPSKSVVRQIAPTIVQPSKPIVAPARSLKKTVTIKMPGNTSNIGASNVHMTQTKYALVEMTEGGKKVMRCIQLNSVDDGQGKRGVVETADEPEQAEHPVSEDLKVIEIVPDEESDEDIPEPHEPIRANDDVITEQELTQSATSPPPSWLAQGGATTETVHASPTSQGSRPGIFETLKSMTVEEASAAVAAVTVLRDEPTTVVETLASDPKYNIVHRGDDHLVIENPGYSDEGEDDDATLSCDEEPRLVISEPRSLSHTSEPCTSTDTSEAPREICHLALSSKTRSAGKGKNVAKRTGGRPHVASKNTAKRTGGRPMTSLERYGLDIKECHVSLEKLYNTKSTVRWIHRHMFHILCCHKGQPGMRLKRLKRLRRERAKKLAPPSGDESSEIPQQRRTREKSKSLPQSNQQAAKTRTRRDKESSSLDVGDTTVDGSDVSDMTYTSAELIGEPERKNESTTEEPVQTVTETTVASEEKQPESIDRSRKRKRAAADKTDIVTEQTGQEMFLVLDAKQTDEKAKKASGRKRKAGPTQSAVLFPVSTRPVTTSIDCGMPASKSLHEMQQITTSKQDCVQSKSVTGFLQGRPSCVSGAESLISVTGAGEMTPVVSPRATLVAPTLGIKMSGAASLSGASSILPTGARNIVSASGAVQKLIERSPSCNASNLGAGHFIATGPDGRTLLIRRTGTPESPRAEFASPAKGKYYLVKTEQKAYLVPVDKIQVQKSPKSEKLILVPTTATTTTTSGAVESTASVNRQSPLYQPRRSEGNTKAVVTIAPDALGEGTANAPSVQSPEPAAADYEPAVNDMRQEDRISLLKEKLRLQQEKVEKMRKKKVD